MSIVYNVIREAMLAGANVRLFYQGHVREVSPHVIGLNKQGREQALTFQYGGGSNSGLPPGGEWRCIPLGLARDAEIIGGPWHTDESHNRTQTCVAQIDVELWVGADGKPYVKAA